MKQRGCTHGTRFACEWGGCETSVDVWSSRPGNVPGDRDMPPGWGFAGGFAVCPEHMQDAVGFLDKIRQWQIAKRNFVAGLMEPVHAAIDQWLKEHPYPSHECAPQAAFANRGFIAAVQAARVERRDAREARGSAWVPTSGEPPSHSLGRCVAVQADFEGKPVLYTIVEHAAGANPWKFSPAHRMPFSTFAAYMVLPEYSPARGGEEA